ncbi:uncharacterized protein LOC120327104 isoform X2 [Styela clava]|uniref:uncharacterized protein LOC120327104 isoform X2 n=1 Tax=Styela clava TaxID=7725 RepID=UPI00193A49AB|nr:uncharacterized protein LOC120327104 isoform X2 [Styela clava]
MLPSRHVFDLLLFVLVMDISVAIPSQEEYDYEDDGLLQMILDHILHQIHHTTEIHIVQTKTVKVPENCYKFCAKKKEEHSQHVLDCVGESQKIHRRNKRKRLRKFCFMCRQKCDHANLNIYI